MATLNNHLGFSTPSSVGRGRGMHPPIPFSFGSPIQDDCMPSLEGVPSASAHMTTDQHNSPPIPAQVISTSTPSPTHDSSALVGQMSSIIQEIGHQLADSIMSRIQTPSPAAPSSTTSSSTVNAVYQPSQVADVSQVQIVTQRKVKEPPAFRGDGSDTITVHEWEDLMRTFIRKSNMRVEEQAEEILVHLRGKAKDIVKFGVRNSNIDIHCQPDMIYGLLRKHFSCTKYSTVPLADFYSTLPKVQEDPYDYWLRLNRAADVAAECLREQGKTLDNPEMEVARMFIRNCPCKDLALTFRSKTIDKWSACEVLEVLNEYHTEMSCKVNTPVHTEKKVSIALNKAEVSHSPDPAHIRQEPLQMQNQQYVPLAEVVNMLEKVLLRGASAQPQVRRRAPPRRSADSIEGFNDKPCIVCKDVTHSALSHCREKGLCFQCHATGHTRRDCPERRAVTERQGN